jgi:hypothetical protein
LSDKNTVAQSPEASYWFRIPDGEIFDWLLEQTPAVIKTALVILRSIQRDQKPGELSDRELARRAGIGGVRHVIDAVSVLLQAGFFIADSAPGRVTRYGIPFSWKAKNCIPTGEQFSKPNRSPRGEQLKPKTGIPPEPTAPPEGEQCCTPRGEHPIRNSDSSESSTTTTTVAVVHSEAGFTPEDLAEIDRMKTLIAQQRFGKWVSEYPDTALVIELRNRVPDGTTLEACLGAMPNFAGTKGWGRFLTDARRHWHTPERRAAQAEWTQRREQERKALAEERVAWTPPEPQAKPPRQAAPPKPRFAHCGTCRGVTFVAVYGDAAETQLSGYRWCTCEAAIAKRAEDPGFVDRETAAAKEFMAKMAKMAKATVKSIKPTEATA